MKNTKQNEIEHICKRETEPKQSSSRPPPGSTGPRRVANLTKAALSERFLKVSRRGNTVWLGMELTFTNYKLNDSAVSFHELRTATVLDSLLVFGSVKSKSV